MLSSDQLGGSRGLLTVFLYFFKTFVFSFCNIFLQSTSRCLQPCLPDKYRVSIWSDWIPRIHFMIFYLCPPTFKINKVNTDRTRLYGSWRIYFFHHTSFVPSCLANQMLDIFWLVCTLMDHAWRVHLSHWGH